MQFSQRSSTADVLLGSKYASAYIYKQVGPIEIICIIMNILMNIFAVTYLFLTNEEWNKVAMSDLKFQSLHFILV